MADLIQAPAVRITYPGIDNPMYDSDVRVANEMALSMVAALSGLMVTDFAIISGVDFVAGVPNTYTGGFVWINGAFYFVPAGFTEGNFISPNPTPTQQQGFNDGNSRPIYTQFSSIISPVTGPGFSPVFNGNMNQYRMGNKYMAQKIVSLLATQAALKQGAFRDVGTVAGTVAAGDDPRMPYTAAQLAALFVIPIEVILKGDSNPYTPVGPNDPVNKNYTDTNFLKLLDKGRTVVGDVPSGGITVPVAFHVIMPNTAYQCHAQVVSLSNPVNPFDAAVSSPALIDFQKSTGGCSFRLQEAAGGTQNVALDWFVF